MSKTGIWLIQDDIFFEVSSQIAGELKHLKVTELMGNFYFKFTGSIFELLFVTFHQNKVVRDNLSDHFFLNCF